MALLTLRWPGCRASYSSVLNRSPRSLAYFWVFQPGRGSEASWVRFPLAPNLDALRCAACAAIARSLWRSLAPGRSGARCTPGDLRCALRCEELCKRKFSVLFLNCRKRAQVTLPDPPPMWPQSQNQSQVLDLVEGSPSPGLWVPWHLSITTSLPCRSCLRFLPDSYCLRMCLLYFPKDPCKMRTPPSGRG